MNSTISMPVMSLFGLMPREKQELVRRIRKWRGLVRIFVHPMYEKWRWLETDYALRPSRTELVKIENFLFRLLSMPEERVPPVIIMEEDMYSERLAEWLQKIPGSRGYYIPTRINDATPTIAIDKWSAWKLTADVLSELGIKKILIGGMQLEISDYEGDLDHTGTRPRCSRCVGTAITWLSRDKGGRFELEVSAMTMPAFERSLFISCTEHARMERLIKAD